MATIEVIGTEQLERDLNRLPEAFAVIHARFSQGIAGGWKKWILDLEAVKKRSLLFSVAARVLAGGEDAKAFVIDTDNNSKVIYSEIVEMGKKDGNYAKGKPGTDQYGGRYPARKALDAMYDTDELERISTRTLNEFLHG